MRCGKPRPAGPLSLRRGGGVLLVTTRPRTRRGESRPVPARGGSGRLLTRVQFANSQRAEQDFATVLDRRLKRIEEMKLIEASPTIDGVEGKPADVRLPPVVPDRRFRRI